ADAAGRQSRGRRGFALHETPSSTCVVVAPGPMTLAEAAARVGVAPGTLRAWQRRGLIPQYRGDWTTAAIGEARVVARMRARGHTIEELARATREGRLAYGFLQELFPLEEERIPIELA